MADECEYPDDVLEAESPFEFELDRLTELLSRSASLGLSIDDQKTIQEATIALRVLIANAKRGNYDRRVVEHARREAAKLPAAEGGEQVLRILGIVKSTTSRGRMLLRWLDELDGKPHSKLGLVHDYLNLYPAHHDPRYPGACPHRGAPEGD